MTVFKTFWDVVKKYKGTIILYTVLLIIFGGINMSTSDKQISFVDTKPDVLIINNDRVEQTVNKNEDEAEITKNLVKYIEENSNIVSIENNEEKINDALFYRDVNYIIYIPENYGKDVLKGENPKIDIKSTGDYNASLAEMMLTRYIKVQNLYISGILNNKNSLDSNENINVDEIITNINNNLSKKSSIEMTSKLDTEKTENATVYFNFASYSIMAVVIFVVCLVLSSFHERTINKRIIVSSMNYKKHNRQLLIASFVYSIIVWALFIILGVVLVGDIIFTTRGAMYALNALVFTFCSLTIALFISTVINNKNAVSGLVNVIALGSAFLCGAFVPAQWLPDVVLNIAHILPAYWYINSNELLKTIEVISFENLGDVFINILVMIGFSILFVVLNNVVSKRKQKVG